MKEQDRSSALSAGFPRLHNERQAQAVTMGMDQDNRPIRALLLLSGGLDSQLAVCVLKEQGIAVSGLAFESPFFSADRARQAATQLGIPLRVEDFTADLLAILEHPRHGFGAGMNPCIDCHTAMVRLAGRIMEAEGFHFLATGEVLDERPMSQTRRSLELVAVESGYAAWLLRPLSAQLLPETEPERRGWVDRARLLSLRGKSRREQLRLAAHYGLQAYPTPAGGCCLTEPHYAARLRDLRRSGGLADGPTPSVLRRLRLLKVGRHFRLGPQARLIVGRNARENAVLEAEAQGDILLRVTGVPGPVGLLSAGAEEELLLRAAGICVRYSDAFTGQPTTVEVRSASARRSLEVPALTDTEIESLRVT